MQGGQDLAFRALPGIVLYILGDTALLLPWYLQRPAFCSRISSCCVQASCHVNTAPFAWVDAKALGEQGPDLGDDDL
eukprot:SAG11_NODE_29318_length_312_cov_0.727700_1_plen_76_part_01